MGAIDIEAIQGRLESFLNPEADPRQARRREQILRAATELFVAYGYKKTTMDDVASAAGVAKGTLYLYYRNKAELLLHAVALQKRQAIAALAPIADPTRPAAERLRELVRLSVTMSHELPLFARFTTGDEELRPFLEEADPATLRQINEERVDFAAQLIDEAAGGTLPGPMVRQRAALFVEVAAAAVNGGRLVAAGMPVEDYARELAELLVEGIVRPASDP
ncbi:MAG: TetR family transcriptional regulator [Myxococcota bacterium]